jgi:hypothetical protein
VRTGESERKRERERERENPKRKTIRSSSFLGGRKRADYWEKEDLGSA